MRNGPAVEGQSSVTPSPFLFPPPPSVPTSFIIFFSFSRVSSSVLYSFIWHGGGFGFFLSEHFSALFLYLMHWGGIPPLQLAGKSARQWLTCLQAIRTDTMLSGCSKGWEDVQGGQGISPDMTFPPFAVAAKNSDSLHIQSFPHGLCAVWFSPQITGVLACCVWLMYTLHGNACADRTSSPSFEILFLKGSHWILEKTGETDSREVKEPEHIEVS